MDEELDPESFLIFLGVSIVPMGGIFVLFVIVIVSDLYSDLSFENKYENV